jgi:hypothetical protein
VFKDTFRNSPCLQDYTPGEPVYSYITLYSSALNDPPEYETDPSKSPPRKILGLDVHTLDSESKLIDHRD